MADDITIEWQDFGREPQCAPDSNYPAGKDLSMGVEPNCYVELPYPAKRCGLYIISCAKCGLSIGVTTAGRADDPRSIRLPCKRKL
jgi:hypothetical protein